jgi:Xaa-Pro aminopeptidase
MPVARASCFANTLAVLNEFIERRRQTLEAMGSGALVLFATPSAVRNSSVQHPYRPDSDIVYLTGCEEPECVVVLTPGAEPAFTLFLRERNPEKEVWDGARLGTEGARRELGADQAFPIDQLDAKLPELLAGHSRLYHRFGFSRDGDEQVLRAVARVQSLHRRRVDWPTEFIEPGRILHELRLKKRPAELVAMQRAIDISVEAHLRAMSAARPGMHEYELEALLFETFRSRGAQRVAYESIVASGPNATTLHHVKNDRRIADGELLLIDAGAEVDYYASDLTRTFPVSGRFSVPQRRLYDIVLGAQLATIAAVRPGATLEGLHDVALHELAKGLLAVGLVQGSLDEVLEKKLYEPFYMHRTSHFLGMDVHDVGRSYVEGKPRALEPGMVLTVEPGLYVRAGSAPAEYEGIGIRIEDDVLVTAEGSSVLSAALPKRAEDLERACSE